MTIEYNLAKGVLHETTVIPGHPNNNLYERGIDTFIDFLSFNKGMTTET